MPDTQMMGIISNLSEYVDYSRKSGMVTIFSWHLFGATSSGTTKWRANKKDELRFIFLMISF